MPLKTDEIQLREELLAEMTVANLQICRYCYQGVVAMRALLVVTAAAVAAKAIFVDGFHWSLLTIAAGLFVVFAMTMHLSGYLQDIWGTRLLTMDDKAIKAKASVIAATMLQQREDHRASSHLT